MAENFSKFFVDVGDSTFQSAQNNPNDTSQSYNNNPQQNVNHEHFFRAHAVDMNTVMFTIKHFKKTDSAGSNTAIHTYKTHFLSLLSHILLPR